MIDLGAMSYFLGIEVKQTENEVFIFQTKYLEILKRFKMEDCKEVSNPMYLEHKLQKKDEAYAADESLSKRFIWCLMYLTVTRPNILH